MQNSIHINDVGIYNSKLSNLNKLFSKERKLNEFYLEYYIYATPSSKSHLDGKEYKIEKDSLLIAKPNQIKYSHFHFKCYYLHLDFDKDSKFYSKLINAPDYIPAFNNERIMELFKNIVLHSIEIDSYCDAFILSKTEDLLNLIIDNVNTMEKCNHNGDLYMFVSQIKKYIEENYFEKITLEILSKKFGYSPTYLQTLFKQATGKSPQECITHRRLIKAKEMLMSSSDSLSDIALNCGFSSQAHFCFLFKKNLNITPLQYRKQIEKKYNDIQ